MTNKPASDADTSHRVSLEQIEAARRSLVGRVRTTPMLSSETAARVVARSAGIRLADDRLYLKAEHLQRSGSFKVRGAINRVEQLTPAERAAGVIAISAGNHAMATAIAGRSVGVKATVVMPEAAVRSKVDACIGYGAEVILHGKNTAETWAHMEQIRDERGLTFVHPFNDPAIIAGQGTIGLEILDDLPDVDVVVAGIGGGGLVSGVAIALKERRPGVRVYGVEPEKANGMSLALQRGEIVPIQPASIADGLNGPFAGDWTLPICQRYLDDLILLDDPTILGGVRYAAERMKQVLEPAGAAALAAVLYGKIPLRDNDRVCVIASGGNVEITRLGDLIAQAAPLEIPAPS